MFDILPLNENIIKRDTLLYPPEYIGKYVITNPPYLAKNKTNEFSEVFEKYSVDDLYKAAMKSIIDCSGGILIIPSNFFFDENSKDIRKFFLSEFIVDKVNVFTEPMFDTTTYSVCSFFFHKEKNDKQNVVFSSNEINITVPLEKEFNYSFGGDLINKINLQENYFSRIIENRIKQGHFATNIFLTTLDTRSSKINVKLLPDGEFFSGKISDRIYASLTCSIELDKDLQEKIINDFNNEINDIRKKYNNLIFSNYRDFGRKRVGFDFCYKFLSMILDRYKKGSP